MGPDWCEENLETIVDWLRDGAKRRGLPFIEFIARRLIKQAIAISRRDTLDCIGSTTGETTTNEK